MIDVAIGWNTTARGFGPVRVLRSLVDSQADASTRWRDQENYSLAYTFSRSPLVGSGFGHAYVDLANISGVYPLEPYVPHNSVLGLWAYGGLLGFALLWVAFPVGFFFALRAYLFSRTPLERVTSLAAAGAQICYLMQGYGDLGFGAWGGVFTVAASYALTGKICVATGAWPAPRPSSWHARPARLASDGARDPLRQA